VLLRKPLEGVRLSAFPLSKKNHYKKNQTWLILSFIRPIISFVHGGYLVQARTIELKLNCCSNIV
jgi:hypothetical protein